MNLTEYVPLAIRTEKPLPQLSRMVHGCLGLITEIGEVTTEIKRMVIYQKPFDVERKVHILEEAGDVMWYIAIVLDTIKFPLDQFEAAPIYELPDSSEGVFDATALMLAVHCGKICEATAMLQMAKDGADLDVTTLIASIAMVVRGMYILSSLCGSNLWQVLDGNIEKLRIRYPEKYSNEAAEARADKNGADARVS